MARVKLKTKITLSTLKKKMDNSKSVPQYKRWQVIYLLKDKSICCQEVADIVGIALQTVYKWVYWFNNKGIDSLVLKGRGGKRKSYLDKETEKTILIKMQKKAEQGLIVIAKDIKKEFEKKIGHSVSNDYIYDVFHRHGWRKIKPRPKHPKSSVSTQKEFKKNFRTWSPK